MQIRDLSVPALFWLSVTDGVMTATHGTIVIECAVPGVIVDWIGPMGCHALCTIAEGLLVIHERAS